MIFANIIQTYFFFTLFFNNFTSRFGPRLLYSFFTSEWTWSAFL